MKRKSRKETTTDAWEDSMQSLQSVMEEEMEENVKRVKRVYYATNYSRRLWILELLNI
jgi:hypothetical protein